MDSDSDQKINYSNILKTLGVFFTFFLGTKYLITAILGYISYNGNNRYSLPCLTFMLSWIFFGLPSSLFYLFVTGVYEITIRRDEIMPLIDHLKGKLDTNIKSLEVSAEIDETSNAKSNGFALNSYHWLTDKKTKAENSIVATREMLMNKLYSTGVHNIINNLNEKHQITSYISKFDYILGAFFEYISGFFKALAPKSNKDLDEKVKELRRRTDNNGELEELFKSQNVTMPSFEDMAKLEKLSNLPPSSQSSNLPPPTKEDLESLKSMMKTIEGMENMFRSGNGQPTVQDLNKLQEMMNSVENMQSSNDKNSNTTKSGKKRKK